MESNTQIAENTNPAKSEKRKAGKSTTDPLLLKLYEKERAIRAQIAARINKEKKSERSAEAQRLIIAGRAMQAWAQRNAENAHIYDREINAFCTRPIDRERMGLAPLSSPAKH